MNGDAPLSIAGVFEQTRGEGRAALMPYLTLGYPSMDASLALVRAAVDSGADMVELGVPFSDPLADGPVIQHATQVALESGTTVTKCLDAVRALRASGITVPLMLMGYYNPIAAFGEQAFAAACGEARVSGLIVPDLPPEEGAGLEAACARRGVGVTYLLAPTSGPQRVRFITTRSQGFVYLVSVAGVTGARDRVPEHLAAFVAQVRGATAKPLAVGFGISTPDQAREISAIADGIIVGSAVVRLAGLSDGVERVAQFVALLRSVTFRAGHLP